MSPESHQHARHLLDEALARPEVERMPFLQAACVGNSELLAQVTQLLSDNVNAVPQQRHIGRYLISRELGRGAMGIVYEAVDPLIGRKIAVKVIRLPALADGAEADFLRERLFREARSAGGLFHPCIAVILDVGQDGDVPFIAMEYVEGPSLSQMLAARPKIGRGEAIGILRQTAAALDFAHSHGIVHRDIKPANIMLENGVTVKVADFGIAKMASAGQYTQTGTMLGTPSYMSPEQLDAKPLDGRSDQFSLAVVAYELLTGAQPFRADSFAALVRNIVLAPRPSARAANPELPAGVDQVLHRGLGKLPDERYANCREFVAALEGVLASGAEEATRATIPLNRGRKRSRYIGYSLLAAVLLAAGGLGYIWTHRAPVAGPKTPHAPQPQTAPVQAAPQIARFLAEPQSIKPGEQAMLSWEVAGATEVDVQPGIGQKPAAYSVPVKPGKSTTYKLTAANAAGTARGEAFVEVQAKPPEEAKTTPPNAEASARALQLYLDGVEKLRAKQLPEGVALLRQAGDLGDTQAMLKLGDIYGQKGPGHIPDPKEAVRWYRKAAEAGDAKGMLFLGGCYDLGTGVPADDALAMQWYRKAAEHGSSAAMYNLARMYEEGRGVSPDLARALPLYRRAAGMGDPEAKSRLALLTAKSPDAAGPRIASVRFSESAGGYALTIAGSGFGSPTVSSPYTGGVPNFRIGDATQAAEWGYRRGRNHLTFTSWSDSVVAVSGFGGQPGDAVIVVLWNAASGTAATWGGNVPTTAVTPRIASVRISGTGPNVRIVVQGSGFGPAPATMPAEGSSGNLKYFHFLDFRSHCGGKAWLFDAGFRGDSVTLGYRSWSNSQIVISGFGGTYGEGCAVYQPGDPIAIAVWNTTDGKGPATAWGGTGVADTGRREP
jgi:serine/threonine-protein kinase